MSVNLSKTVKFKNETTNDTHTQFEESTLLYGETVANDGTYRKIKELKYG